MRKLSVVPILAVVASVLMLALGGGGGTSTVADTIATITTDQVKYSLGETMTITGADFTRNGPVSVTVLRPDHATDALPEVTADDSGGFTTTYSPPSIPGRYKITATDGTNTAKTAATEADVFGAKLAQCRNGGVGEPPIDCTDSPTGWENGNAGKENAHYAEGQSIPYRLVIQDTGGSLGSPKTIRVSIEWDTVHSDAMAIDYITYPRRIAEAVDPCDGAGTALANCPLVLSISGAANPAGVNEFDLDPAIGPTGTSPLKSYTTAQMPAGTTGFLSPEPSTSWNALTASEPKAHKMVTIGGTIVPGTMAYQLQQDVVSGGSIPSSASSGIQFDVSATSNNVVLSWGGHIASRFEWGFLNGSPLSAGGISGSPYHMRLIGACNNSPLSNPCTTGGNQDRSLSAAAVIAPETPTVTTAVHLGSNHTTDIQNTVIPAGSTVHDSATVGATPTNGTPTGNVSFTFYNNGTCEGTGTPAGTVSLNASGVADPSNSEGPLAAGSYSFKAHYVSNNTAKWTDSDPATDPCEPFTAAQLSISTVIHLGGDHTTNYDANVDPTKSVALNSVVHDKATLGGIVDAITPTGAITFTQYTNDACSGDGSPLATDGADGTGTRSVDTAALAAAGSYSFKASVASDANYNGATSLCEKLKVNKGTLSLETFIHSGDPTTDVGDPGISSASAGTTVHDKAKVEGIVAGFPPANPVTFTFWRGAKNCTDGTSESAGSHAIVGTSPGIAHPSDSKGPLAGDQYAFRAHLDGDSNYEVSNGGNSACEPLDIIPTTSDIATTLHEGQDDSGGVTIIPVGGESATGYVHDKVRVDTHSGFAPTGTVTIRFFGNDACTNDPLKTSSNLSLDSADTTGGVVDATSFYQGLLSAGKYAFQARYNGGAANGDPNNDSTNWSTCEPFMVTTITINKLANGGNDTFGYTVSGPTPSTPNIATTGTPGTGTTGAIVVLSGGYTVGETTIPAGWHLVGSICSAGSADSAPPSPSWSFTVPAGTNVTCDFENTKEGKTRTQGFWATHTAFANSTWNTFVIGTGEENMSTWGAGCALSTKVITAVAAPGANRLMGGFWANIANKTTNPKARIDIDKARMALLQQILAALLNKYGLGTGDGGLIDSAQAAYCGTNKSAITAATSSLSAFNQSGDSVALGYPVPGATPKESKTQADIPFWNTTK